jgi:hypothetical protein
MKKIKVSSIVTRHCNLGNGQMKTTFFHVLKSTHPELGHYTYYWGQITLVVKVS